MESPAPSGEGRTAVPALLWSLAPSAAAAIPGGSRALMCQSIFVCVHVHGC